MDKIVRFEEIADCFIKHGRPERIYINRKESGILANNLPNFYTENQCNKVFSTGYLGYLKEVPVLPGSVGKRKAKLYWK